MLECADYIVNASHVYNCACFEQASATTPLALWHCVWPRCEYGRQNREGRQVCKIAWRRLKTVAAKSFALKSAVTCSHVCIHGCIRPSLTFYFRGTLLVFKEQWFAKDTSIYWCAPFWCVASTLVYWAGKPVYRWVLNQTPQPESSTSLLNQSPQPESSTWVLNCVFIDKSMNFSQKNWIFWCGGTPRNQ